MVAYVGGVYVGLRRGKGKKAEVESTYLSGKLSVRAGGRWTCQSVCFSEAVARLPLHLPGWTEIPR